MTTRRDFLWTVLGGAAAAALGTNAKEGQDDDLAAARAAKGTKTGRAAKPARFRRRTR